MMEGCRFPRIKVGYCDKGISEVTEEMLKREGVVPCPKCGVSRSCKVIERLE